jgi:carbonic anhydrase/acetyltransferase-like protein (isoleucine patch superfamily)
MPAYQLDQFLPDIDPSCWIAPCATIIGNVVVGSGSSIWFGSVVRGDNEPIGTLAGRHNTLFCCASSGSAKAMAT